MLSHSYNIGNVAIVYVICYVSETPESTWYLTELCCDALQNVQ